VVVVAVVVAVVVVVVVVCRLQVVEVLEQKQEAKEQIPGEDREESRWETGTRQERIQVSRRVI
jgi:hypothetical protein